MTIHLLNPTGAALTACNLSAARRAELTADPTKRTCDDCRSTLIGKGFCPACAQKRLRWRTCLRGYRGAETVFYLACDNCSETALAHVSAEAVAAALTAMRWQP